MTNETNQTCQHCGKPVGAKAIQGLCPACLLKVGLGSVEVAETKPIPFDAPAPEDLADLFPQLEILEKIGAGGMGAVYRARQRDLDRIVALKILAPRGKEDPSFTQRFTREARALARLSHPHIVAVHDFGQAQDLYYFIMEYVDGTNLRRIQQAGPLSPKEALTIIPQICEALQFAHDHDVVHRDIKPENILLDKDGSVKIADFGLAKVVGHGSTQAALTQEGHVMGTPHYMAPEQVEHPQDVDHRADIYSLGVVFYEMLTGELPLGTFQPPSQKVQVDVRLDQVVLKTLAKEPQRRYQQVSQVGTEVHTITTTPAESSPNPVLKTSRSLVSTPAYLKSFKGRFWSICQAKGELELDENNLSFQSGWQMVSIPLADIRSLAQGHYPLTAKPLPYYFMGVTFDQGGVSRTLLFTPYEREGVTVPKANLVVQEWFAVLQEAMEKRTGRAVPVETLDVEVEGFWQGMLKTFVLTAVLCTPAFLLIPVICEQRLPKRLGEFLPGIVVAAGVTLAMYLVRLIHSRLDWTKSARSLHYEQLSQLSIAQANALAGLDYKSKRSLWGLPLVHVATGMDPDTGRKRVARGIIAIGDIAQGVIAFGGVALGGLTFGGLGVGIISFGGLSLGLVALGGLAIGLGIAVGGGAFGYIATGGLGVGYYAFGGIAEGVYAYGSNVQDPLARAFFEPWAMDLTQKMLLVTGPFLILVVGIGLGVPIYIQRLQNREGGTQQTRPYLKVLLVDILILLFIMAVLFMVSVWT